MSIVLGYDQSPGSRPALAMAVSLASRFDEPLVLVYGAEPPGGLGEEFRAHQRALAEMGRAAIGHAVAEAAVAEADAAGVRTVVEVLDAKPAQALVEAADRHGARVIVVGTSGESPLRGAILGSVPHKLLQISDRPVLCVPAVEKGE
jgi:nucleotide-binding universal stress UspA family protein